MAASRFVISGRVQGVGYRAFVMAKARELGVKGEVWNRADGWVEILAQHDQSSILDLFRESLPGGPGAILGVDEEPMDDSLELEEFKISFSH
jgi:acylphosphatase